MTYLQTVCLATYIPAQNFTFYRRIRSTEAFSIDILKWICICVVTSSNLFLDKIVFAGALDQNLKFFVWRKFFEALGSCEIRVCLELGVTRELQ